MIATDGTLDTYEVEPGEATGELRYYRVHPDGRREEVRPERIGAGRIIYVKRKTLTTTGKIKVSAPSGYLHHVPPNRHERRAQAAIRKRLRKLAR